jgi:hypothetical protein
MEMKMAAWKGPRCLLGRSRPRDHPGCRCSSKQFVVRRRCSKALGDGDRSRFAPALRVLQSKPGAAWCPGCNPGLLESCNTSPSKREMVPALHCLHCEINYPPTNSVQFNMHGVAHTVAKLKCFEWPMVGQQVELAAGASQWVWPFALSPGVQEPQFYSYGHSQCSWAPQGGQRAVTSCVQ